MKCGIKRVLNTDLHFVIREKNTRIRLFFYNVMRVNFSGFSFPNYYCTIDILFNVIALYVYF